MITREKILQSIKYVVDNSTYVSINEKNIDNAISLLRKEKKQPWLNNSTLAIEKGSLEQIITYLILCESLNFCYWNTKEKWKIEYNGEWFSGSFGLFLAIDKAIANGIDLLNVDYLEQLTIEQLDEILTGTTSIPMLEERFAIIKQLATELRKEFVFSKILAANNDIELLNVITDNFENFKDISLYKGKEIFFFKRAILLVGDLILNIDAIKEKIKNDNNMIGCADYKIPQVLRHLGILEYRQDLATLIDSKQEIPHNSEMEIEIRANMLWAIELINEKMKKDESDINSIQIDNSLWLLSKNPTFKDKPHHLTTTIYY